MSKFTDDVVKICMEEFKNFKNGKATETQKPQFEHVGRYWKEGLKMNGIDGRTTFQDSKGKPFRPAWSSAFISFVMRKAGAGDDFHYNQAHSHYIIQGFLDAKAKPPTAAFLARDPASFAPKVGDLIHAGRESAKNFTFDDVKKTFKKPEFYSSHSDIVVEVDAANKQLFTIGGNVLDTVGRKTWKLDANGIVQKSPLICILECRL